MTGRETYLCIYKHTFIHFLFSVIYQIDSHVDFIYNLGQLSVHIYNTLNISTSTFFTIYTNITSSKETKCIKSLKMTLSILMLPITKTTGGIKAIYIKSFKMSVSTLLLYNQKTNVKQKNSITLKLTPSP